jgi:hypothetical protein
VQPEESLLLLLAKLLPVALLLLLPVMVELPSLLSASMQEWAPLHDHALSLQDLLLQMRSLQKHCNLNALAPLSTDRHSYSWSSH